MLFRRLYVSTLRQWHGYVHLRRVAHASRPSSENVPTRYVNTPNPMEGG